ncbi:MAG TPA: CHRD domain-containing protein [Candidatus Acidoferrum sp.]|nr:CHRD domain-containing protein [Candidatus Acidoferrum sp.]
MKTRASVGAATLGVVAAMFFASFTTAQINIESVRSTNSNSQLRFDVTGGGGPFVIQRANLPNDPWCSIATFPQRSNIVVGVDGPHAFFRVRDLSNAPATRLTVSLSGAAAGTASAGDGFGTFEVITNTLKFDIAYRGLSSGTMIAHIHGSADTANSTGVIIDFGPFFITGLFTNNGRIAGSVPLTDANKAAILGGLSYVNIHTTNFAGGEIRGQITPTTFRVVLSGAGERPNTTVTPAYGLGMLTLIGNQLTYHVNYQGLNSTGIAAHIHGAAPMGTTAPVMYHLQTVGGFGITGVLSGRTNLTPAQIAAIVDGKAYVNIHTTNYPGGEVRGQVLPVLGESPFAAEMTGIAENPDVTTPGSGFAACTLQSNVLTVEVMYRNLKSAAIAAHIHGVAAYTTNNVGILHHITNYHRGLLSTQGVFVGSLQLTPSQITNLYAGDLYVNIHTTNHPGGEVRGQLCPTILPVSLDGASAGITTPATGFGYIGLLGRQFSIGLHYRDLIQPANNAHLHGPAQPGVSAGTLINLNNANYFAGGFGTTGFLIGSETITDTILSHIVDGITYVNIHSGFASGGEIRGNVIP